MESNQAIQQGQTFLRNGQDIAQRSPVNADTLYMWDNQVQAIETYLANTEPLAEDNEDLAKLRIELRDVKKQIETKVLEFELKEEGEEMPPEPTPEEAVEELKMYAEELSGMLDELEKVAIGDLEELRQLDEARAQLDNFLVETEPHKGADEELDKIRARVRELKTSFDETSNEILRAVNEAEA